MIGIFSEALRGFPLLMYLAVDAFTALIFSAFISLDTSRVVHIPAWKSGLLVFAPVGAVLLLLLFGSWILPRYNFAKSDTFTINKDHDVVQYWLYLNRSSENVKQECQHLKEYALERGNAYPRTDGVRHRRILLFQNKTALRQGTKDTAWVTYEWWPDGRVVCSADKSFR